ncbi:MAG: hypothetical protein LBL70_00955 [Treponema sp.]|jgi:hypothetical protein|nr:hypothetical protein [Treponema sp.]
MIKETLDSIIVGSPGLYNMFSLEIEIEGKSDFETNPTVFHEYTHYLQNMTTINGFINLDKYIHSFLLSFTKLGANDIDPPMPLNKILQNALGDRRIENILESRRFGMDYDYTLKEYTFCNTDMDDYVITECDYLDKYSGEIKKVPFIAIDGKNVPINEITIKENMALVNSIIGNIQNDLITEIGINEILEYKHKEYNVIFDFISHYLPKCNLLKMVYCLCEISLNISLSEQVMGNILRFIQVNHEKMSSMETEKILYLVSEFIEYDKMFNSCNKIIHEKAITKTQELFSLFDPNENQFVDILKKFYGFLINGLDYRSKHKTLYINKFSNEYLQKIASIVGCPIIYFKDLKETRFLSETSESFLDDFIYLHASLKTFTILYNSVLSTCPFLAYDVCAVRKNKFCYSDCIKNYESQIYENCLLSNALTCSGVRQLRRKHQ